ncbi:MAG: hypothetical protein MJ032_03735 [Acidaminococcaceae bacterium]|nr:hypothetical protein [Acidaminococcaceae bacterium]
MNLNKFVCTAIALCVCGVNAISFAYETGERSKKIFEDLLNPSKHNVHIVLIQKIDMSEVLSNEAYQQLEPEERIHYNRYEYNETSALCAERQTTYDGNGRIIKDINTFAKENQWFSIDYVNKTYDRLPELLGMVKNFRETFVPYFEDSMPESGFDDYTGYDYDKRYKSDKEVYFYFEKDTDILKGYEISGYPRYNVMEFSQEVDVKRAFALPPEDYLRQPNEAMRAYATKLIASRSKKKSK